MASFTDTPINFTPYQPENPTEAMLYVGMNKERQYAEGLQKVQTYVDTLGGLDISKQEIKDYVQTKMGELHQNLNNISGDFSDNRLVSQIGGAASKIANDPVVQNGIIATAEIRNGYQKIETARKEGKSNANNEIFFTDEVAKWQNDGQVNTRFTGQYTPYFDIVGKVRETFKDMTGGQELPPGFGSNNIKKDANGNVVFDLNYTGNMVNMEGISVARIQNAIDLVMQNGNARQQLNIDGYAKYRGLEGPQMFDAIVGSTQKQLDLISKSVRAAQSKLGGATDGDKPAIIQEIKSLEAMANQLTSQSEELVKGLGSNLEGVKASLVEQQLRTDLVGAFAYQKMVESPLWNQNIELERFRLEQQKFTHDQENDERNYKLAVANAETARLKAEKEAADKGTTNYTAPLPVSSTEGAAGSASMYKLKDDSLTKSAIATNEAINEYAIFTNQVPPYKLDQQTNKWIPNAEGYGGGAKGSEAAKTARLQLEMDMKSRRSKGTLPDGLESVMQKQERAYDDYKLVDKRINEIEKDVLPQVEKLRNTVGTREDGSRYPSDWFDMITVRQGLPGSEVANQRLNSKYGEGWQASFSAGTQRSPIKAGEHADFFKLEKKVKSNKDIVDVQQQVENKFRASQFAYQNKATVFDRSKSDLQQDVKTAFTAALTEQALVSPEGDAADIRELLNDKTEKQANDQYMAWVDYKSGAQTYWVGIMRGNELKKVQITPQAFLGNTKLQEAVPNVEFQNRYASRLALRGGQDTFVDDKDVTLNNGQVSSYPVYMQSGTIKYTDGDTVVETVPKVQYHLQEPANARGQYRLKLYITDSKTGKVLISGAPYPPEDMVGPRTTPALTQEAVIQQVDRVLANPLALQGYIDKYYNKK